MPCLAYTCYLISLFHIYTVACSSVVTCDNPKHVKDVHSHDGLIDMPVNPELKTTPVGVCEWTVTKTPAQKISDNADIHGSSTVVW